MRRLFSGALVFLLAVGLLLASGCVQDTTGSGSSAGSEQMTAATAAGTESAEKPGANATKAAVILGGSKDDYGFNYNCAMLAAQIEKDLGIPCVIKENVPPTSDCEGVMEELIAQGCKIIFPSQFGYLEYTKNVAARNPDVAFYSLPITDYNGGNFSTIHGEVQEAWYLCGIIAAMQSETGKIGFIGSIPIPDVIVAINAFTLGAQSVKSDISMTAVFTGSWADTGLQTTSCNQLIDNGCDIIAPFQDSVQTIIEICASRGAHAFGCNADALELDPDTWLSAVISDWTGYTPYMKAAMEGNYECVNISGSFKDHLINIARYGNSVTEETKAAVEAAKAQMISGDLYVFEGPVYNQDGDIMFAAGYRPPIEEINVIDELVQGVTGSLN